MSVKRNIVQWALTGMFLAAFNLIGQPIYEAYLSSVGHSMGVGELALGYFAVFCGSYVISHLITRHRKEESQ